MLHAAYWKYSTQKIAIWAPSHKFVGLFLRNYRRVSAIGKNLLSSNISPTCPYNMVNFGPLAAEIVSLVWGTPANFNRFRVLAALPHSQIAALNRGRHLYSAGRPSRCPLAHISSFKPVVQAYPTNRCLIYLKCRESFSTQYISDYCRLTDSTELVVPLTFWTAL